MLERWRYWLLSIFREKCYPTRAENCEFSFSNADHDGLQWHQNKRFRVVKESWMGFYDILHGGRGKSPLQREETRISMGADLGEGTLNN